MFVLIAMFIAGSIGASGGFILGGMMASGRVSDLELRVRSLEALLGQLHQGAPDDGLPEFG